LFFELGEILTRDIPSNGCKHDWISQLQKTYPVLLASLELLKPSASENQTK